MNRRSLLLGLPVAALLASRTNATAEAPVRTPNDGDLEFRITVEFDENSKRLFDRHGIVTARSPNRGAVRRHVRERLAR